MAVRKKAKLLKLKKVRPTKRYLVTQQRALKRRWRGVPEEEKSELKRLIVILAAILLTLAALYYVGINLLTNIGGFWATLRGQGNELFHADTIAPPPPYLSPLPLYSNNEVITIGGYAEAGAEVTLFVNEAEVGKTIAEKGGQFTFSAVTLNIGENTITATAKDGAGNESTRSSILRTIIDKEPPELVINQPSDGQQFSGEDNKITIAGTTESGATVKINGSQASVLADGSFNFTVIANQEGTITLTITATDRAGNETKTEIHVDYSAGTMAEEE